MKCLGEQTVLMLSEQYAVLQKQFDEFQVKFKEEKDATSKLALLHKSYHVFISMNLIVEILKKINL